MKSLDVLVCELKSVDIKSGSYVADFERILGEIFSEYNEGVIEPLLLCFNDSAPYDVAMFSIIHGIESFEDKDYIGQLLKGAEAFYANSPGWATTVFMRVINSEECRNELALQVATQNDWTKDAVKRIMERVNDEGAEFKEKTAPVIAAIHNGFSSTPPPTFVFPEA